MVITADRPEIAGSTDLLTRARGGEASAFCQLAAAHERRLLQQACGLTHELSAAEDLVAETLVEAWRSIGRYNGTCRTVGGDYYDFFTYPDGRVALALGDVSGK